MRKIILLFISFLILISAENISGKSDISYEIDELEHSLSTEEPKSIDSSIDKLKEHSLSIEELETPSFSIDRLESTDWVGVIIIAKMACDVYVDTSGFGVNISTKADTAQKVFDELNVVVVSSATYSITSSTSNYSLNSDKLDGKHWSEIHEVIVDTATYSNISSTSTYALTSSTTTYATYSSDSDKLDGFHYDAFVSTTDGNMSGLLTISGPGPQLILTQPGAPGGAGGIILKASMNNASYIKFNVFDTTKGAIGYQDYFDYLYLTTIDDMVIELGDDVGSNKLVIKDSNTVEVASIDSDGNASFQDVNVSTITFSDGTIMSSTSTFQGYDADLDDLADGTLSKSKVEDSGNWDSAYGWGDHSVEGYRVYTDSISYSADSDKLDTHDWSEISGVKVDTATYSESVNYNVLVSSADYAPGDNLGNHTATQDIDASSYELTISTITATGKGTFVTTDGKVFLGTGVFPGKSGSTDTGIELSETGRRVGGLCTEVNGQVLSYAINTPQVCSRNTTYSGGIFRIDTRAGYDRFGVLSFAAGEATSFREPLVINLNTGFVGISRGISPVITPARMLHISGSGTNSSYPYVHITDNNSGHTLTDGLTLGLFDSGGHLRMRENWSLNLWTNDTIQMTILGSGNTGIGTASPGSKLEVNGTIDATAYKVGGTAGWTGTFYTVSGSTVTVTNGLITNVE